jgi:hypothetical protein
MNKKIMVMAIKKFNRLSKKYNGFINVFADDWRGFRFIYDTEDMRRCNNNCVECNLFKLLKNEKDGLFSAGLYRASREDKKIFGSQKFLNCKTLEQYQNCYVNFLVNKARTREEVKDELILIKNLKIIFSKNNYEVDLERKFKRYIFNKALILASPRKKKIIQKFIFSNRKL